MKSLHIIYFLFILHFTITISILFFLFFNSTQYLVELSKLFKILGLNSHETVDISDLNYVDKKIIYNLIACFKQHQYAIKLLYKHSEIMSDKDLEILNILK